METLQFSVAHDLSALAGREGIPLQREKETSGDKQSVDKPGAPCWKSLRDFALSDGTTTKPIATTSTQSGHFLCYENRT